MWQLTSRGPLVREAIETSEDKLPFTVCQLACESHDPEIAGVLANIAADERGRYLILTRCKQLLAMLAKQMTISTDKQYTQ
jgi:hypothetical protein